MPELFARTLSQGLQAFMPIAVCLVWLRHSRRDGLAASMRLGLLAAIPLTAAAGWLFQNSSYQARWESLTAIGAVGIALAGGLRVWPLASLPHAPGSARRETSAIVAVATAFLVLRQTMLMGAVLGVAVLQVHSLDATVAIAGGTALALGTATALVWAGHRLSPRAVLGATKAFAALFLAQVVFYAVHKSAEARFLPWGEALDAATEPYGPDGVFGRYVSDLLVGLPVIAAAWCTARGDEQGARRTVPLRRAALATAAGLLIVVAAALAATGAHVPIVSGASSPGAAAAAPAPAIELTSALAAPHLMFISRGFDATNTALSAAPLQAAAAGRAVSGLHCERASFAAGRGICLQADRGVFTTYRAVVFDDRWQSRASFKLDGSPSRTRMAPDGRVGAITVFVTGLAHGYSSSSFSTKTTLVDMASGDVIGDLEQFSTWRDGKRLRAADLNFWGVSFARDSNTFYASLRTGGQTSLVRGDLRLRTLTVLHDNVECPSLSPDNRLIGYKKNVGGGLAPWRFYVLDLATMKERPIAAETRSIDDQLEWLDDGHVLYGATRSSQSATVDVYVAAIDGHEPARVFLPSAESPIVVR